MNKQLIFTLKVLRKAYHSIGSSSKSIHDYGITDPDKASDIIYDLLASGKPCMIARFGSTELIAIINYLGVINPNHSIIKFIKGEQPEWWWNENVMDQMQRWSGFFPPTPDNMMRFGKMMLEDAKEVDVLGCWIKSEQNVSEYTQGSVKVHLRLLEPFWSNPSFNSFCTINPLR